MGLLILCFCVLFDCSLVVSSTSAIDCLQERLVPKWPVGALSGTLNSTHYSLFHAQTVGDFYSPWSKHDSAVNNITLASVHCVGTEGPCCTRRPEVVDTTTKLVPGSVVPPSAERRRESVAQIPSALAHRAEWQLTTSTRIFIDLGFMFNA